MAPGRRGGAVGQVRPVNAGTMRQVNRQLVLAAIRRHGPISRAELGHLTGLSQPAITGIVRELIREGLVREIGVGQSSGGRPPILLVFNPTAQYVLAATLEGDSLRAGVADLSGQVVAEESLRVDTTRPSRAVQSLIRLLDDLIARIGGGRSRLAAIGIGVPGIAHAGAGTVSHAPSLGWWKEVPLRERLERYFKVPVVLENDVNLMTLGEYAQGAGAGVENLVLVHVGLGIGAGILIGGRLYRGARDAAGEVGYLPFGPWSAARRPGDYGLFEQHYSARGLALRMQAAAGGDLPGVDPDRAIALLCHYARMAIPWARALLDDAVRHWAYAVAALACILNPERVLLAGQIEQAGEEGLQRIRAHLAGLVPVPPEVRFASLGARAGLVGAVAIALAAVQDPPLADLPPLPGEGRLDRPSAADAELHG
ncbi:MAG: ROK family transcriptional regulator [Firmicutes bacterium]|nr:ROK family transcriptional regulator [Bacillota bacterium]